MPELDPDIAALIARLAAEPGRPKIYELPLAECRRLYVQSSAALAAPDAPAIAVADREIPGPGGPLTLRTYTPDSGTAHAGTPGASAPAGAAPGLVFFHGGGWVVGGLDTHDPACRRLAARTGAVVVAVDYRLAPEHKFPAALEDAHAATVFVAHHAAAFGIDPQRLAVGGDSAGGNLAAAVAHLARDEGLALAHQLLIYPATTGRTETGSYAERATGSLLERAAMAWFYAQYERDAGDRDNPLFAPLRSPNLERLAPAIVVTAGFDPLRDDGELYAAALEKSGVAVRHLAFPSLTHDFLGMDGVSRAAEAAGAAIADALRQSLMRRSAS